VRILGEALNRPLAPPVEDERVVVRKAG